MGFAFFGGFQHGRVRQQHGAPRSNARALLIAAFSIAAAHFNAIFVEPLCPRTGDVPKIVAPSKHHAEPVLGDMHGVSRVPFYQLSSSFFDFRVETWH